MATIWGVVHSNGKILSGTGFTVHKDPGEGVYDITFVKAFPELPAVLATQLFPNQPDSSGGNTKDNAVVVYIDKTYCRVVTGNENGHHTNRDFSFMAVTG